MKLSFNRLACIVFTFRKYCQIGIRPLLDFEFEPSQTSTAVAVNFEFSF
jgi:hypothetical protein